MIQHVIIDGLNMLFRAHHAAPFLTNQQGTLTGTLYVFLRMLSKVKKQHPWAKMWFVWDGSSKRRRSLSSDYKSNRVSDRVVVDAHLKDLLKGLGIHQVINADEEADDVIYTLSNTLVGNILIISTDRDLLQCLESSHVRNVILQCSDDKVYDVDALRHEYGITPEEFPLFRCFVTDNSDVIKGIDRFPKKVAAQIVSGHKTLDSVYSDLPSRKLTDLQSRKLAQHRETAILNLALTKSLEVSYEVSDGIPDQAFVEETLRVMGIKSFNKDPFFKAPPIQKEGSSRKGVMKAHGKLLDSNKSPSIGELAF